MALDPAALGEEGVAALTSRTEGWIVGVHLAALSLRGRPDATGFIAAFAGSRRYVVDYLGEEVRAFCERRRSWIARAARSATR